jgi:hypothetical protein
VRIIADAQTTQLYLDGQLVSNLAEPPTPIGAIALEVYSQSSSSAVRADYANFSVSALP